MSEDDSRNRALQAEIVATTMISAYKGLRKILIVLVRRAPNLRLEIPELDWNNLDGTEELQMVSDRKNRVIYLTEGKKK